MVDEVWSEKMCKSLGIKKGVNWNSGMSQGKLSEMVGDYQISAVSVSWKGRMLGEFVSEAKSLTRELWLCFISCSYP